MLNVLPLKYFFYYQYLSDKLLIERKCEKTFLSFWLY